MTTPDRPDDRHADRPRGGVRGVIDDLLGRHDEDPHQEGRRGEERRGDERYPDGGRATGGPGGVTRPVPGQGGYADPTGAGRPAAAGLDPYTAAPGPQGGPPADGRSAPPQPVPGDHFGAPGGPAPAPTAPIPGPPANAGPGTPSRPEHPREGSGPGAVGATTGSAHGTAPHQAGSGMGDDASGRERLFPQPRAQEYGARWDAVKGAFVDEPRQAVRQADALVGEVLDELERLFREQRAGLEHGLDTDDASTEDLRLALRRYRSFFDRLLSL